MVRCVLIRDGALDVHFWLQWLQVTTGLVLPVGIATTSAQIGSLPPGPERLEPLGGMLLECMYMYIRRGWMKTTVSGIGGCQVGTEKNGV
jgi:hypothetical protein